jgi:catechol 2,3-dioxygenase-like lactoylglutathione lyase family enzyme
MDHCDVSHICIAVDDLDRAMVRYGEAFGMEWAAPHTWSNEGLVLPSGAVVNMPFVMPLYDSRAGIEGLSGAYGINGMTGADGWPAAVIELAHAEKGSPAFTIWGCPPGHEYMHHIGYWVSDVEAESRHLITHGFAVEFTIPPGDVARGFGYHVSAGGLRIELLDRVNKPATWKFHTTGVLENDLGVLGSD